MAGELGVIRQKQWKIVILSCYYHDAIFFNIRLMHPWLDISFSRRGRSSVPPASNNANQSCQTVPSRRFWSSCLIVSEECKAIKMKKCLICLKYVVPGVKLLMVRSACRDDQEEWLLKLRGFFLLRWFEVQCKLTTSSKCISQKLVIDKTK